MIDDDADGINSAMNVMIDDGGDVFDGDDDEEDGDNDVIISENSSGSWGEHVRTNGS